MGTAFQRILPPEYDDGEAGVLVQARLRLAKLCLLGLASYFGYIGKLLEMLKIFK